MKKEILHYIAPEVETIEVTVEQGFASSVEGGEPMPF